MHTSVLTFWAPCLSTDPEGGQFGAGRASWRDRITLAGQKTCWCADRREQHAQRDVPGEGCRCLVSGWRGGRSSAVLPSVRSTAEGTGMGWSVRDIPGRTAVRGGDRSQQRLGFVTARDWRVPAPPSSSVPRHRRGDDAAARIVRRACRPLSPGSSASTWRPPLDRDFARRKR